MNNSPAIWFIVPAAGIGQRMGADIPKQYLPLGDTTILEATLTKLLSIKGLGGIVVATHPEDTHWSNLALATHEKIHQVTGGDERSDSVLAALDSLNHRLAENDWVLVHDAARPCVHPGDIEKMLLELEGDATGGILATPASDTLKKVDQGVIIDTPDRRHIWQAQTPQMFRFGVIHQALKQCLSQAITVTDEASAVEKTQGEVKIVAGRADNIKVTRPEDLWLAEAILKRQQEGL